MTFVASYLVVEPLSSLNPTISGLCPGASFTMSDSSVSHLALFPPPKSNLSAAGPLLASLVSGCLMPHLEGKPTVTEAV